MSVIIRLQNLPLSASAMDIRVFFHGLSIPDGGVHIVGGKDGDAFIAFSSDEDARQAMNLSGEMLKECTIKLLLSSRNEMFKVIEQARFTASGSEDQAPVLSSSRASVQNGAVEESRSNSNISIEQSTPSHLQNNAPNPRNMLPNANMAGMGVFGSGINQMGLQGNNSLGNPFQNSMKLTPQMNPFMPGFFPQQPPNNSMPSMGQQQPPQSPFMITNTPFGANPILQGNPIAFPGMIPGMGMIPGVMPGVMNQQHSNVPLPSPFNQTASGIRPGQQPGQGNVAFPNIQNHVLLQGVFQPNNANMPGRPDVDNFNRNGRFGQTQVVEKPQLPSLFSRVNSGIGSEVIRGDRIQNRDRERERDRDRDAGDKGRRGSEPAEKRAKAGERRKRSRSRDRPRKRSRSRSRSRSRADRRSSSRRNSTRSNSRERSFGDHDSRNVSASDQDLIIDETQDTTAAACVMLSNVPNEASYRDVREFLRADARLYGVMRDFEKGTACIRLDNVLDLDKVLRNNGRKLYGKSVHVESVSLQVFDQQAKEHGAPIETNRRRDSDGDRGRSREFDDRGRNRDNGRESRKQSSTVPEECCLIIEGLPVTYNGAEVANVTLEGVIKNLYSDIHIHEEPVDRQGRQFATAFVKFHSFTEAEKASDLIAKTQGDLKAHVTDIEELDKIRRRTLTASPPRRGIQPFVDEEMELESCNVMLRGIPLNMTERDVSDFFLDTGSRPKRVKLLSDAQTGNRIAKAICEFNDIAQARRASMKDGQFFGRNTVGVRILPPKESLPPGGPGRNGPMGPRPKVFAPPTSLFQLGPPQDENPFVKALNNAVRGGPPPPHLREPMRGGMRGRGMPGRGRGGVRLSRFAPADSTTSDNNHHENSNPPSYFERSGCVLALTNIPFSANMDQIIQFMEETIEKQVPHDRIIRRFNEFQKPTGDARVAFNSPFETKQAFDKLQGARMWGRLLDVSILNDF